MSLRTNFPDRSGFLVHVKVPCGVLHHLQHYGAILVPIMCVPSMCMQVTVHHPDNGFILTSFKVKELIVLTRIGVYFCLSHVAQWMSSFN